MPDEPLGSSRVVKLQTFDASEMPPVLSSPGASKIRLYLPRRDSANRYSKGFEINSKLDRIPAGKSDEPARVIEICTIYNIQSPNKNAMSATSMANFSSCWALLALRPDRRMEYRTTRLVIIIRTRNR